MKLSENRLGIALAILASVSAFTGCVKFGIISSQAVSGTCHIIDAGEKATLLLAANHQLKDAWLAPIKACVVASQPTCNADPMPTSVPAGQYSQLLKCADAFKAASVPNSVPAK